MKVHKCDGHGKVDRGFMRAMFRRYLEESQLVAGCYYRHL
jgi:hypothetical protein